MSRIEGSYLRIIFLFTDGQSAPGADRAGEKEGNHLDLQECSPHLPLLPSPLCRLRVHVQAPVINKHGQFVQEKHDFINFS